MSTVAHTLNDSTTLSVTRNASGAGTSTNTAVVPDGEMWIVQLLTVTGLTQANVGLIAKVGWGLSNGVETLDATQGTTSPSIGATCYLTPFGGASDGLVGNGMSVTSTGFLMPCLIGMPGQTITARVIGYVSNNTNVTATYRIFKLKLYS